MAKNVLKSFNRFELLRLIYDMRKENSDLSERCSALEKELEKTKAGAEKRLESTRMEYENRLEELRMQGASKELQVRMKKIEEQMRRVIDLTHGSITQDDLLDEEDLQTLADARTAGEDDHV